MLSGLPDVLIFYRKVRCNEHFDTTVVFFFCLFFSTKMLNISWFQLLECTDLLLFVVIFDSN